MSAITDLIAGALAGLGKTAIDVRTAITGRDPVQDAKLQEIALNLEGQARNAETQLLLAQMEINKIESASTSFWKSGWRPAVGWIGAVSLAAAYWPRAVISIILWAQIVHSTGVMIVPPDLGVGDIIGLLGSILGIGTMRSYDKMKGTST